MNNSYVITTVDIHAEAECHKVTAESIVKALRAVEIKTDDFIVSVVTISGDVYEINDLE